MQLPQPLLDNIQRHEQYAKADAANVPLQMTLGDLYHQAGRFDDALACYERCLALQPNHPQARSRSASVLISQHRFAEAELLLRSLLGGETQDPALQHNLGLILYFQHRFDEARALFAAAAASGLAAPSNFAYLARSQHHLGAMPEAIDACKHWVAAAPGPTSQSYLALLHFDNGDGEQGRTIAMEVLTIDPENVDANVVVGGSAMERQESTQARACFETALRHDKDNGRAWLGLGLVHLYEQETEQAIAALGNAVRIYPDNSGMIVTLGWAKLIARDAAGAEQVFEQALREDRTFSESHAGLAAALALQNKLDRAQEEIRLARRLDPRGIGADVAQSFLLAAQGKQQAASDVFAGMLKKSPQAGVAPLIEQLRIYSAKKGPIPHARTAPNKRLDS